MQRYTLHRSDQDAKGRTTSARVLEVTGPPCQFFEAIIGVFGIATAGDRTGIAFSVRLDDGDGADYLLIREDVDQTELEQAQVQVKQAGDRVRCLMEALDQAQVERDAALRGVEQLRKELESKEAERPKRRRPPAR